MKHLFSTSKIILNIVFILIFLSCKNEKIENDFSINGNITNCKDSTVVYLRDINKDLNIDSTLIINNKFSFFGKFETNVPEQLWLTIKDSGNFFYTNLLVQNGMKVTISGDIKDFPDKLKVSDNQKKYRNRGYSFIDNKIQKIVNDFYKLSQKEQIVKQKSIQQKVDSLLVLKNKLINVYILSNSNSYSGLIELGYKKHQLHKDTVLNLFNNFSKELRNSKYGKQIEYFLNSRDLKVGDDFINFKALNKKNEEVKLSNLVRDKYTLLDFRKTACAYCFLGAKDLREIYKNHKNEINIISFCVDGSEKVKNEGIKRDTLEWECLWNRNGKFSKTYANYNIKATPTYFLINPKGKIIFKQEGNDKMTLIKELKRHKIIK